MRIGIDARKLDDFGIGRYLGGLLGALASMAEGHEITAIVTPRHESSDALPRTVRRIVSRAGKYSLREFVELSVLARRERFDLFHAPHFTVPIALPCPAVVTIHDLIHLRFPAQFGRGRVAAARLALAHAVRSERIIAVSAATARDLTERLGVPRERIAVVLNGLAPELKAAPGAEARREIRRRLGFDGPYLLYVGNEGFHKNLPFLLRCFASLPPRMPLVLAGPPPDGSAAREVAALGLTARVRLLGFVTDALLPALYREAEAFVLPSLIEGFGLPVVEAMAQEVPVLVSDVPALAEIAGDAALRADPHDAAAFTDALVRILEDAPLRDRLRAAGLRRASEFGWDRAARETLAVYASVGGSAGGSAGSSAGGWAGESAGESTGASRNERSRS